MSRKPKILALTGSLRENSYTKRVVQTALRGAENAGAEVTFIDLRDFPMPLFNSDDEQIKGLGENVLRFQELLARNDGFMIASPEYNGSLSAALKNAIDWASRSGGPYKRSDIFTGKFAAIMTASPGSFGGVRVLSHMRDVLTSIGVYVLPTETAVSFAEEKFSGDGEEMTDERTKSVLENLGSALVAVLRKTRAESELVLGRG